MLVFLTCLQWVSYEKSLIEKMNEQGLGGETQAIAAQNETESPDTDPDASHGLD